MQETKINEFELLCLGIIIAISTFVGIGTLISIKTSSVDAYLSPLISILLSIPLVSIYKNINNYLPRKDINNKNHDLFGKTIGSIINTSISFIFFINSICLFYNLITLIESEFLFDTPHIFIGITFVIIIIYISTKGIEVFTRSSTIIMLINILLFLFATFALLPKVNLKEFMPILEYGITSPIKSSFRLISLNIIPLFMILIIPKSYFKKSTKTHKYFFYSSIISLIMMFIIIFITIGVEGINLASIYEYPEYMVIKNINILDFINRVENIIFIEWIMSICFTISFSIYYITHTIKNNNKNYIIPTIISIIILVTSLIVFKNTTIFNNFIYNILPKLNYILLLIYFIIYIRIRIKKKGYD